MKVELFIPCYVDQFYPKVAIATLELLKSLGCEVNFPLRQTCCGQPMANSGYNHFTASCNKNFVDNFSGDSYIVCPSGSCTLHIKEHLFGDDIQKVKNIRAQVMELSEFITDILKISVTETSFPHKVGYLTSCHGQRGLHLSSASEINGLRFSKPEQLLREIKDIDLVYPQRVDDCCGFGGSFCVTEEALSVKMGQDRLMQFLDLGVEYITGNDMSCLMHIDGLIQRNNYPIKVLHIAEILNPSSK